MSFDVLINLVVQIIAGAIGGNAAGAAKNVNLGTIGNTITGAIGGGVGGQLIETIMPMLTNAGANIDASTLTGDMASGGAAGAVLTATVGLIKNRPAV